MSIPPRRSEAGGDERQLTRRAAIATGAGVWGAGMLWATTASAQRLREDLAQEPNGGGGVYVFNCYNEPVTGLSVSGYAAGDIPPCSDGRGGPPLYTPSGIEVPRSQYPGALAEFAIGDNEVRIPWDSFGGTTTITIPDPTRTQVSLDDDLIVFLAVNSAMLLTTRGYVLSTSPVTLSQA